MWKIISSTMALVVKDSGGRRDAGSIHGSERFPRGGHDNLLQYSCLENPMNREVWKATVHRLSVGHD